jgi:cysteine desulfurase / selenocysteine lyase
MNRSMSLTDTKSIDQVATPISPGSAAEVAAAPWKWWRSQMPVTQNWAYLDHAAVAPLTAGAARAMVDFAAEASQQGDTLWPQWAAEVDGLRGEFAELLNCDTTEIALIPNTSFGINVVAEGLPWQPGDNIVIPGGEFPSNVFPWQNQKRHGVELRIVDTGSDGQIDVGALRNAIDDRTRIVAASWVGYASGFRIDLPACVAAAHDAGALFFLDAIQGLGVFPLDLQHTPIDFLAADGHKWLLGPEGAGVAFIRKQHLELLACVPVGWNSVRAAHHFGQAHWDLKPDASRFEIGSHNMVGMRALRQSLSLFRHVADVHGPFAIADRVLDLASSLDEKLRAAGAITAVASSQDHRSGIVTFSLPGVLPSTIRKHAAENRVAVSCRGIGVRASIHAYNNESDIDRLVEVVQTLATKNRDND